jgi:hypothetical protein
MNNRSKSCDRLLTKSDAHVFSNVYHHELRLDNLIRLNCIYLVTFLAKFLLYVDLILSRND